MTTLKKTLIASSLIAVAVLSVWLLKPKYYLAETAGSQLVCNSRECYLFIDLGKDGWKANGLQLLRNAFVAVFGGANSPTDLRQESLVFVIRTNGAERYWFPGLLNPDKLYQGELYVAHAKQVDPTEFYRSRGKVMRPEDYSYGKWTGTTLEPVDAAKKKEVDAAQNGLWPAKGDSTESGLWRGSLDGWVWVYSLPPDHPVRVDLEGGTITLTTRGDLSKTQSIILKADGREQTLWTIDYRQHRVSQHDYERSFARGESRHP